MRAHETLSEAPECAGANAGHGASRAEDLERIQAALEVAAEAIVPFIGVKVEYRRKGERGDPLTEADLAANTALRRVLPREDEGWLSEETRDDGMRLERSRVWVVDPIDGTREFVEGIPEWCVSIGLVEGGEAVAGGIVNPVTGQSVVGAAGWGVRLNGAPVGLSGRGTLAGATVLASRSEVRRGEWERFADADFTVRPCGSVAYKLGLVAAGLADATWTLVPKNEWDVAAGAALVLAAGGAVMHADGRPARFNRRSPALPDFLAGPPALIADFRARWLPEETRG